MKYVLRFRPEVVGDLEQAGEWYDDRRLGLGSDFLEECKACPSIKGLPQTYVFESRVGLTCSFFIRDDRFVFIGDNTTFTVDDQV